MQGGLFGSGILDVAIGLVLVYLVLSIMASALNEVFSSMFNLRAQGLEQFIRSLFMNPQQAALYGKGLVRSTLALLGFNKPDPHPAEPYVDHFYNNTVVAPTLEGTKRPAYIHAREFSLAIFDTIFRVSPDANGMPTTTVTTPPDWSTLDAQTWRDAINKLPDSSPLKPTLISLMNKAGNDITKFRTMFENWFDNSMDRISGWYKQRTQFFLLLIGLLISGLFNIDTIAIANKLIQNPVLRTTVADQAVKQLDNLRQKQNQGNTTADQTLENNAAQILELQQILLSMNIPIGWNIETLHEFYDLTANPPALKPLPFTVGLVIQKILGIMITGFAVSQGAPFWFDMLNKLTNIRSSGQPPKDADEEKPEK